MRVTQEILVANYGRNMIKTQSVNFVNPVVTAFVNDEKLKGTNAFGVSATLDISSNAYGTMSVESITKVMGSDEG